MSVKFILIREVYLLELIIEIDYFFSNIDFKTASENLMWPVDVHLISAEVPDLRLQKWLLYNYWAICSQFICVIW